MEEENQVFGKNAEAVDSNKNLESEDFKFYHQNKEEAKSNIDSSSKDLTDFIDSLIQDVPAPSDEEVNAGIEKILETTHPTEEHPKTNKKKKVTFKVLFIAALLSILSFSCLYVVGSSHNISIENGFVTFAKDTIKIVFFGESKEEYITVDALLTDLDLHGYKDILFPQEFVSNSDEYKVGIPIYSSNDLCDQVTFNIADDVVTFIFSIHDYNQSAHAFDYVGMNNIKTIIVDNIHMYVSEFDNGYCVAEFMCDEYRYSIQATIAYSEMVRLIKTINKGE